MKAARTAVCAAAVGASLSLLAMPTAFAGDKGKTPGGCSNPYTLATYDETGNIFVDGVAYPPNVELINTLGAATLYAILQGVDHNGDFALCFKLPHGWTSGNTLNRTDYVNLVDNKTDASS